LTIFRLIAPEWLLEKAPYTKRVLEGQFSLEEIQKYNQQGYNIYYLPNYPKNYNSESTVDGSMVDCFNYVFVDCDLKDGVYKSKDDFMEKIAEIGIHPTRFIDSGNGCHVYWKVLDLDAMSYLKFQRRLMRLFNTDEAVGQLFQLMRYPGTLNTKKQNNFIECELLFESEAVYTSEELNNLLPALTKEDEEYCKQHYDKTHNINQNLDIDENLPPKFGKLLRENSEVKSLFAANTDDRSKGDFRLANILLLNEFTKDEAMSVLINTAKASSRAPKHRISYAKNIVDKIWTTDDSLLDLSSSVEELLNKEESIDGERFVCYKWIDDTVAGFRLGQVMGLVAGSGVGKTALALNLFKGFVANNPNFEHFFVPLEQPGREIAQRWKKMCGDNKALYKKVHIISNYDDKGNFRDLSLKEIQDYILKFKEKTGKQVGCVVIDHIGVLKNDNKHGIAEGKKHIAKAMKSFAVTTNTFLIMQSQTSREKAGIGDLELNKDAAMDTSAFEHFVDYLVTMWQPVKRMYSKGAPTIMAYKFCKIRHKNQLLDNIKEDVCYTLYFDPENELVRELTQLEEKSFDYWLKQATNKRKEDRKTEIIPYVSAKINGMGETLNDGLNSNKGPTGH
jgi:KaiC/GvpD/RAD55 family RecA-like ATPase